jgi:ankyrin repeat protein
LFGKYVHAFFPGDCKMVKLLLAKGAYVDLEAHCGTPLHVAATKDHDGAMKILLDHNADVSFKCIPLISRKKVHTTS